MKIAIYGRIIDSGQMEFINSLLSKIQNIGAEMLIHDSFRKALASSIKLPDSASSFSNHEELSNANADVLFSIGGDGTLLDTVTLVRDSGIPIFGINTGRLGFLSSVATDEIDIALESILNKNYNIDKRTLLQLHTGNNLFENRNFALNEFTVHKQDSASMITIHSYIDGEYFNSYWADGLIVATPTGSTAYSLSCGGPIVLPGSGNLIITPIAPHNLNVRPVVIPDDKTITLKLEGRTEHYLLALDARSKTTDSSIEIKITRENYHINLLRLQHHSFLHTLRNKLMWGVDKRN